jgi:CRISPR-associated endonuclease Csn1
MKKIPGLDIGTNSIGWALVENNSIKGIGSRIIPMGAEVLNFEKGNSQTKNTDRRSARSIRRMREPYKARRNKLLYTLQQLSILPKQFQFSSPFDDPTKIQKINLLPVKRGSEQLTAKTLPELKVKAEKQFATEKTIEKIIDYFLKHDIANVLANKIEFGSLNCYEKVEGVSIRDNCINLQIDRPGNITFPSKK